MDKPNPGSDRDKEIRQQQASKAETGTFNQVSRDTEMSEQHPGRMERMVGDAFSTTEHVGSGMVDGVTHVATDLVHGVGTIAGEAVAVVRDTANTAIAGVGSVGETAVHTVTGLLADLVGGLRDIGSAATRGRAPSGMENENRHEEVRRHREEAVH